MIQTIKKYCKQHKIKRQIQSNTSEITQVESKGLKLRISEFTLNDTFFKNIKELINDVDLLESIKITFEIKKIRNKSNFTKDQVILLENKSSPDIYKSYMMITTSDMIGYKEKELIIKLIKEKLKVKKVDLFEYKINNKPITKSYKSRIVRTYKTGENKQLLELLENIKNANLNILNSKVLMSIHITKDKNIASISTINTEIKELEEEHDKEISRARFTNSLAFYKFIELEDNFVNLNLLSDIKIEQELGFFFINKFELVENIKLKSKISKIEGSSGNGKTKFIEDYMNYYKNNLYIVFDFKNYPNHFKPNVIFNPVDNFYVDDNKIRFVKRNNLEEINTTLSKVKELKKDMDRINIVLLNVDSIDIKSDDLNFFLDKLEYNAIIETNKEIINAEVLTLTKDQKIIFNNNTYYNNYRK